MAAEDLESIEAMLELLSNPEAQRPIGQAEEEVARGDVLSEAETRAPFARRAPRAPE
ncbi:MAG TPA: hypothetical protein VGS19_08740 [Streptosporangiaceae bacterium]|nr:hypothetical protein [Streptosporangiaceae bacterium]